MRTVTGFLVALVPLLMVPVKSRAALPDLKVNRQSLTRTIEITTRDFAADDCAIGEGCVRAAGVRKLLLFDTAIANIGKADLRIGDPADRTDIFVFDDCHGHYHFKYFATFKLLNSSGAVVRRVTRKRAFCIRDDKPFWADAPPSNGYLCDNQGITRGWQDNYPKTLACQYLDITGVPRGQYVLHVTVNPLRTLRESSYSNNTTTVPVTIR